MGKLLILLSACISITFFCAAVQHVLFRKRLTIERRVSSLLAVTASGDHNYSKDKIEEKTAGQSLRNVSRDAVSKLRKQAESQMSKKDIGTLEKKLQEAGNPFGMTAVDFRLTQLGMALFFFLMMFMTTVPRLSIGKAVVLSVISGCYGLFAPGLYLNAKKKRRLQAIQKGMPDFFDLVNLSLAAGMGLDGSIATVCRRLDGPLTEEFMRAMEDIKLGKSRRESFTLLRERISLEHFQSIISAIIQADQLGIGMSQVLRSMTVRFREQRREAAREKAMKAPVKMMFPMVLFIFPVMFVILLGPLVIGIITGEVKF